MGKGLDMAFDIMKLFDDESFVSPGSIGGKIKNYRELKGWSQRELGIRCGFSASTADVRIAQYEKNKKIPREKALKDIAGALGLDECALFDADMLTYNTMYHALFDMEDFHGLHPVKKSDGYYLEFSGPTILDQNISKRDFEDFLAKWYEMRQKYLITSDDKPEDKDKKIKEYALWRGEYPNNVARETSERMQNQMKMHRLQAEMDALNAKMKNDEELSRVDKALESALTEIKNQIPPIERESDLIYIVKAMIEGGINVSRHLSELEPDYENLQLLSVKTEEILNDDKKKLLMARLVYAIEVIKGFGVNISRKISSRENVLFITYTYPATQRIYFENLSKYWKDMSFIIEREDVWSDWEIEDLEDKFKKAITGENDIRFSDHK